MAAPQEPALAASIAESRTNSHHLISKVELLLTLSLSFIVSAYLVLSTHLAMERLNIPIHISKIRPLDDFLLQADRFKIPDFSDLPRVNHRMTANLLYYQTNYFISLIIIFTLLALCSPTKFSIGLLSLVSSTAFFLYLKRNKPTVEVFQANHPALTILAIFSLGYLAVYLMDSVAVFLMATLFPLLLILVHSALRQRNLSNKINEKAENFGIKKTPMGMVLDFLGQELDKIE